VGRVALGDNVFHVLQSNLTPNPVEFFTPGSTQRNVAIHYLGDGAYCVILSTPMCAYFRSSMLLSTEPDLTLLCAQAGRQEHRLQFLLKQAEVFQHFAGMSYKRCGPIQPQQAYVAGRKLAALVGICWAPVVFTASMHWAREIIFWIKPSL
jgi:hypothetical protein